MCNKLKYAVSFKVLPEYGAFLKDPLVVAVKDMARVHGIGTKTALKFYDRFNLKSVEDLRALLAGGDPSNILKRDMRISLEYLEDLEERIPREEAKEIGDFVRETVEKIVRGAQVEVAGSYRRGKVTCGDVDVLVCLRENQRKDGVLQKIVDDIDRRGLISARLSLARNLDLRMATTCSLMTQSRARITHRPSYLVGLWISCRCHFL